MLLEFWFVQLLCFIFKATIYNAVLKHFTSLVNILKVPAISGAALVPEFPA